MEWIKKGLIFSPDAGYDWMKTHAQLPTADNIAGATYRVYFAGRDSHMRSHIASVDMDLNNPQKTFNLSARPVLEPGPIGFFDEHGVYPASLVTVNGVKYLYYIGWNKGVEAPLFYASIGLAISEDDGRTFRKYSKAPIMARSEHDPCLVTSPFVMRDEGIWRMYYVSGFNWERVDGKLKSQYHIKYAESMDGIEWKRDGRVVIGLLPDETNIARMCVLKVGGVYRAWYSYISGATPYRMGYAESVDGINFTRMDARSGLEVSQSGFDADMTCYPFVVLHDGRYYMFYNGNAFGRDGFGLAVSR